MFSLVDPASVRATGCCLFRKAYTRDWIGIVGIRLVAVVEKIKYILGVINGLYVEYLVLYVRCTY